MTEKKKAKRIKKENYQTEEQKELMGFVKILIIIILLVVGVYFFTKVFVVKEENDDETKINDVTTGEINYGITNIGSMLNKKESEYYVMIYNIKNLNAVYYGGLISAYSSKDGALKVYFADLNNELNKNYVSSDTENINTNNLSEFKVKEIALLKIKNGKVIKALNTEDDIAKELAI